MNTKLVCAFALASALAAGSAVASEGVIFFNGLVTDQTCVISGGTGTDGAVGDITVDLQPVNAVSLATPGSSVGTKRFDILVSDGVGGPCVSATKATFGFKNTSLNIDPANGNLSNTLVGESNAQLRILDQDLATPIDLRTAATKDVDTQGPDPRFIYGVQYFAKDVTTVGQVQTNVEYEVTYQ
jgi:major type 1 subunit fimbrin (pilin)